jgi:hypothetical protein
MASAGSCKKALGRRGPADAEWHQPDRVFDSHSSTSLHGPNGVRLARPRLEDEAWRSGSGRLTVTSKEEEIQVNEPFEPFDSPLDRTDRSHQRKRGAVKVSNTNIGKVARSATSEGDSKANPRSRRVPGAARCLLWRSLGSTAPSTTDIRKGRLVSRSIDL